MDIISVISERWLEFAVAVYLVGMILYGHHKGFIRLVVSVVALVISLITVHLAVPYTINWIKHNTPIYENVKSWVEETAGLDEILRHCYFPAKDVSSAPAASESQSRFSLLLFPS